MVSARLPSKSYTCFQWTGAECRTFQHQHSQSPGTWTKNLERRRRKKKMQVKCKQQFIWYQLQKQLITDTINLHTGFVLTGNFLYFTSQDQHLPHPPKQQEQQQQKSIRHTGCYFVWQVLKIIYVAGWVHEITMIVQVCASFNEVMTALRFYLFKLMWNQKTETPVKRNIDWYLYTGWYNFTISHQIFISKKYNFSYTNHKTIYW